MFDYDAPKEKSATDWSGTIIALMLAPVFFVFIFFGKAELGFTTCIVLGVFIVTVRFRWGLRRHAWFWATVILMLALNVPLLFIVRWPQSSLPAVVYAFPLAVVDLLVVMSALSLAERVFSKDSSD